MTVHQLQPRSDWFLTPKLPCRWPFSLLLILTCSLSTLPYHTHAHTLYTTSVTQPHARAHTLSRILPYGYCHYRLSYAATFILLPGDWLPIHQLLQLGTSGWNLMAAEHSRVRSVISTPCFSNMLAPKTSLHPPFHSHWAVFLLTWKPQDRLAQLTAFPTCCNCCCSFARASPAPFFLLAHFC